MKSKANRVWCGVCVAGLCIAGNIARADVETIAFWKLQGPAGTGEGDSITADVIKGEGNSPALLILGNPVYSTDAPAGGVSSGSIKFSPGDALYADQPVTDQVDGFGIELWVKTANPDAKQSAILLSNGRSQPGYGYGLVQSNENAYFGIFDGVTYIFNPDDTVPVTGEWTHLALVRDSRSSGTQLYANGKLIYSSERPNPVPVSPIKGPGVFAVAGSMVGNGSVRAAFEGNIAAVRVFRFKPGEFQPKDLLIGKK